MSIKQGFLSMAGGKRRGTLRRKVVARAVVAARLRGNRQRQLDANWRFLARGSVNMNAARFMGTPIPKPKTTMRSALNSRSTRSVVRSAVHRPSLPNFGTFDMKHPRLPHGIPGGGRFRRK